MLHALKKSLSVLALILLAVGLTQCTKENFVEPPDPFESKPLEPNPATFTLGKGENAIIFKTNRENVRRFSNGKDSVHIIRITGSLYVENTRFGDIRLTNGDFNFFTNSSEDYQNNVFDDFKGMATIHIPNEGIFKIIDISDMINVPIGLKKGSDFESGPFEWPVNPNRYYFYYENPNPIPINISNSPLEDVKKIALDPTDPFFFFQTDINGTKLGDLSDVGLAFSAQGLIPFTPIVDEPEERFDSFFGHIYISGTVPLGEYPASISGEGVIRFPSNDSKNVANFFNGGNSSFALGINGKVNLENEKLEWLGIDVTLGKGTVELGTFPSGFSGFKVLGIREEPPISVSDFLNEVINEDYDFLDYLAPYREREVFYCHMNSDFSDWGMGFKLETWLELPGDYEIDMGHAYLYVDPNIMEFSGETRIAGFSKVGVEGFVKKTGEFRLTGYAKSEFSASWHKLKLEFEMGIDVTFAYAQGIVVFSGNAKLHGAVYLGKLHAGFTLHASFTIRSDGSFEVCFSIGIGKLGFDVCLDFNIKYYHEGQPYHPKLRYTEIPLEQVPIENRFPAEE